MSEASALDELLTLLDTIGSSESHSSSATSIDVDVESSHAAAKKVSHELPLRDTLKAKKDRRRKEGPVMYTTSLQRRKKAELENLREEAQRLNAQLEELRISRLGRIGLLPTQEKNISAWRGLAMLESEGRERAERMNRELKSIMANQVMVRASLQKVLERKTVFEGMEFVFEPQPTADRPLAQVDFSDAILAELSDNLGRLRLEADRVFPELGRDAAVTCRSRHKINGARGNCIETISVTPMACTVQQTADILWHHITTKKNKDVQKSFRFVRTNTPSSIERNCMASLLMPNGKGNASINLDAVNIVRKYEEADRVTLIGTTTWFLPTGGLQFEDHHWTILSPSRTDPLRASVVQSCYQMQVKSLDTSSVSSADFARVEEVVLNSIGGKLRNVLQVQQNVLLDSVDLLPVPRWTDITPRAC